nr:hypothetical protein [uncultured Sphingomonas sp.]
MRRPLIFASVLALSACSTPQLAEPSLAPRAAEAIDPRVPVAPLVSTAPADPALISLLAASVSRAEAGRAEFASRAATASGLAAAAGPSGSESWISAQAALSLLIEQHGIATNAAADVDGLAGAQLHEKRWISPADQRAIAAASAQLDDIVTSQNAAIDRLRSQLAR